MVTESGLLPGCTNLPLPLVISLLSLSVTSPTQPMSSTAPCSDGCCLSPLLRTSLCSRSPSSYSRRLFTRPRCGRAAIITCSTLSLPRTGTPSITLTLHYWMWPNCFNSKFWRRIENGSLRNEATGTFAWMINSYPRPVGGFCVWHTNIFPNLCNQLFSLDGNNHPGGDFGTEGREPADLGGSWGDRLLSLASEVSRKGKTRWYFFSHFGRSRGLAASWADLICWPKKSLSLQNVGRRNPVSSRITSARNHLGLSHGINALHAAPCFSEKFIALNILFKQKCSYNMQRWWSRYCSKSANRLFWKAACAQVLQCIRGAFSSTFQLFCLLFIQNTRGFSNHLCDLEHPMCPLDWRHRCVCAQALGWLNLFSRAWFASGYLGKCLGYCGAQKFSVGCPTRAPESGMVNQWENQDLDDICRPNYTHC